MKKLHVYILHSKALKERDASVKNIAARLQSEAMKNVVIADIAVILSNDPSDIPMDVIQKTIEYSPIQDTALVKYNQFIKNIHINQLSNLYKHLDALKRIAACPSDDDLHLVLEDDSLFNDDICRAIDTVAGILGHGVQPIVFTGLPVNDAALTVKPSREVFGVVPLTDSYFVTKATAAALAGAMLPIKMAWPMQLNYLLEKLGISPYHTTKTLFVNGSKYGMFVSSLNANNQLIFNRDYMLVAEKVGKPSMTSEDEEFVSRVARETPVSKSPDFQYLMARYHTKRKDYKAASECFAAAFATTLANNGVINHESGMLKEYIAMHKHLQAF